MEPEKEEEEDEEEEKKKHQRPPSSYGSMKSDTEEEDEEEGCDEEFGQAFVPPLPVALPGSSTHGGTGYCILV